MGGNRLGGIQSWTVPDIKLFTKQKKSIIVIKSDQNDCLLRVIALGIKVEERSPRLPNKRKTTKNLHLDRASVQMREMQHLITLLKSDPNNPQDELQAILARGASSKRLPASAYDDSSTGLLHYQTAQTSPTSGKPLALQDSEFLSQSQVLQDFSLSVYGSIFMGTLLKCYNQEAQQIIDLLNDAKNRHVDLVTSMKGLFDARHYCYSCQKAFSTVKHLCSASGCLLCRQPGCLSRTGFINFSPLNWTTSSNDLS